MDSVGFELKGSVDMSTGTSEYANDSEYHWQSLQEIH